MRIMTAMYKWRAFATLSLAVFAAGSNAVWYPETLAELRREALHAARGAFNPPQSTEPVAYENSLVLAPLYVDYTSKTPEQLAADAADLKRRIGGAPHVLLGFSAYIDLKYPDVRLDQPIGEADFASTVGEADTVVRGAYKNGIVTHIAITSGFFHGHNNLRFRAIRDDVRNAQWFADGWIAPPANLQDPQKVPEEAWITPSRYAKPLRARIEEGARILGHHLAALMAKYPNTFVSLSGDAETEFTFLRNFDASGKPIGDQKTLIYADYSPFMVAEFRDWLISQRYSGDRSPNTDDNHDGHTFNGDFNQSFATWRLRYYDNSGPISFSEYLAMPEKLPASGRYAIAAGFDAPRTEVPDDPLWQKWVEFRKQVIANWLKDFATWIRTSADPETGFQIPASRYYSHQIPGDMIFGQRNTARLKTSASDVASAVLDPIGSTGVTAFNGFNGRTHSKTATPGLYSALFVTSDNWGIMEYNPSIPYANSIPPSRDMRYYMDELHMLYNYRPHVLIPFAWTDYADHKAFSVKGTTFERALRKFVQEIGNIPWTSPRSARLRLQSDQ